ncbi:hypothetical protein [Nesterenkonia alba]|uniref:hypothetical protein n=1 Tax=Nesterenkonia alba TaxID=515814 RepID=UPI0003B75D05|nr:hypothetical protein [Nesterenkonia alba]
MTAVAEQVRTTHVTGELTAGPVDKTLDKIIQAGAFVKNGDSLKAGLRYLGHEQSKLQSLLTEQLDGQLDGIEVKELDPVSAAPTTSNWFDESNRVQLKRVVSAVVSFESICHHSPTELQSAFKTLANKMLSEGHTLTGLLKLEVYEQGDFMDSYDLELGTKQIKNVK